MRDAQVRWLSALHRLIYKATGGHIGSRLVDNDMLLLTTAGKVTGDDHTVPLLYLRDGTDLIIVASYGGRPQHPQWYVNLVATPTVTVQILGTTAVYSSATMRTDDRERWWPKVVAAYTDYARYQARTDREIPIVRLTPVHEPS